MSAILKPAEFNIGKEICYHTLLVGRIVRGGRDTNDLSDKSYRGRDAG